MNSRGQNQKRESNGPEERRRDLRKKRQCVDAVWRHLEGAIADELERRRKKALCVREASGRNKECWRCEGVVVEQEEELDLEFVFLLLRLLEADILNMEGISNREFYQRELRALRFKGCLACLAINQKMKCSPLIKDCLFRITALVEDAGDDQNKLGFSIRYLSELENSWGYYASRICPMRGRQGPFRDANQRISREFFYEKYDLMNYLKTLATTFRPTIRRPPFNHLLYFYAPAKWFRINRATFWQRDCRRHIEM